MWVDQSLRADAGPGPRPASPLTPHRLDSGGTRILGRRCHLHSWRATPSSRRTSLKRRETCSPMTPVSAVNEGAAGRTLSQRRKPERSTALFLLLGEDADGRGCLGTRSTLPMAVSEDAHSDHCLARHAIDRVVFRVTGHRQIAVEPMRYRRLAAVWYHKRRCLPPVVTQIDLTCEARARYLICTRNSLCARATAARVLLHFMRLHLQSTLVSNERCKKQRWGAQGGQWAYSALAILLCGTHLKIALQLNERCRAQRFNAYPRAAPQDVILQSETRDSAIALTQITVVLELLSEYSC